MVGGHLLRVLVIVPILVILALGITLILAKERNAVGSHEEKTEEPYCHFACFKVK